MLGEKIPAFSRWMLQRNYHLFRIKLSYNKKVCAYRVCCLNIQSELHSWICIEALTSYSWEKRRLSLALSRSTCSARSQTEMGGCSLIPTGQDKTRNYGTSVKLAICSLLQCCTVVSKAVCCTRTHTQTWSTLHQKDEGNKSMIPEKARDR